MTGTMTRQDFNSRSSVDQWATIRSGTKLIDPPSLITPDAFSYSFTENGVRTALTRKQFEALPLDEQSRIGRRLRVERSVPDVAA
jgi:hypothetical protein